MKAKTVLTGVRQVICMQLVMACAAHLLSLVDARVTHDEAKNAEALAREQKALAFAEEYYNDAANGQAQVSYFVGMAAVAAVIGIGAAIWLVLDWSAPVAALVAGALGAVVSVIQRINQGTFTTEYDTGRLYAMFLGGLRPLIGGAFAIVLTFAFTGRLLSLPPSVDDEHRRLALIVVAFVAGFSERWAQDTLAAVTPSGAKKASLLAEEAAEAAERRALGLEQPAAGEADHPVERQQELPRELGLVTEVPERHAVRPGGVACTRHVPHRDYVIRVPGPVQQPAGELRPAGEVRLLDARLHLGEQGVDAQIVGVLLRAVAQVEPERAAGVDERDRQIAVDVRVHARDGELDRRDVPSVRAARRAVATPRGPARLAGERRKGGEEEVGEAEVERLEEGVVLERMRVELGGDAFRHLAVEPREADDAVGARRRGFDLAQPRDGFGDGLHAVIEARSARACLTGG